MRLGEGPHVGPAHLDRSLTILGVDQRTSLSAPPGAGPVLTVANATVAARFLRFTEGDAGVGVGSNATLLLGPAMFERVGVAVRVAPGGVVLLRNDVSIPIQTEIAEGATFYYVALGRLDARDATTGARIAGLRAEVVSPSGVALAAFGPADGDLDVEIPTHARTGAGSNAPVEDGWFVRVLAPGYEEERIPAERFRGPNGAPGAPVPLAMRASAPAAEPPPEEETAPTPSVERAAEGAGSGTPAEAPASADMEPAPTDPEDRSAPGPETGPPDDPSGLAQTARALEAPAPPATPAVVAATVAVGALSAAVAGGAIALRSERRLWKVLALFAPLYTRLKKSALLDNPARERIRAHVEANPGVRYRELQRALGMHNGALAHHLQILVREGIVEETREGQAVRFALPGARPDAPLETGERVLAFVLANPGATGQEVARGLALSSSLAGYHLQRLEGAGRIRRAREGFRTRAYPAKTPEP